MRLVLDANILVSGPLSAEGPPGKLVAAWLDRRFVLVTPAEQIEELRRVLAYAKLRPFVGGGAQARDFVENLEALAELAEDLPEIQASLAPDGNLILATAVAGGVDAVVSGGLAGMLVLGSVGSNSIVTARQAVERLGLSD